MCFSYMEPRQPHKSLDGSQPAQNRGYMFSRCAWRLDLVIQLGDDILEYKSRSTHG